MSAVSDCIRCDRPASSHPPAATSNAPAGQLAERVMKARTASICPKCHCPVSVGNRIARVRGLGWIHIQCCLGQRPPLIGWPSGL